MPFRSRCGGANTLGGVGHERPPKPQLSFLLLIAECSYQTGAHFRPRMEGDSLGINFRNPAVNLDLPSRFRIRINCRVQTVQQGPGKGGSRIRRERQCFFEDLASFTAHALIIAWPPHGHKLFQVLTCNNKYEPAKPKRTSGDQAATRGGSWLRLPMASNRLEIDQ